MKKSVTHYGKCSNCCEIKYSNNDYCYKCVCIGCVKKCSVTGSYCETCITEINKLELNGEVTIHENNTNKSQELVCQTESCNKNTLHRYDYCIDCICAFCLMRPVSKGHYCQICKCMSCNNRKTIGSMYCKTCKCNSCNNSKSVSSSYCLDCKCESCDSCKSINSSYCLDCKCKKCLSQKTPLMNSIFCSSCRCILCDTEAVKGSDYCLFCKCVNCLDKCSPTNSYCSKCINICVRCDLTREENSIYCMKHKDMCEIPTCRSQAMTTIHSTRVCNECLSFCFTPGCTNTRKSETKFCQACKGTCKVCNTHELVGDNIYCRDCYLYVACNRGIAHIGDTHTRAYKCLLCPKITDKIVCRDCECYGCHGPNYGPYHDCSCLSCGRERLPPSSFCDMCKCIGCRNERKKENYCLDCGCNACFDATKVVDDYCSICVTKSMASIFI